MTAPFTVPRRLYVDRYRGEAFQVSFRRSLLHPSGLYHVTLAGAEIGRQVSTPSADDCERLLARHKALLAGRGRGVDVHIPSNRIQSLADMRRSTKGGNKGGRGIQLKKILREVFE